MPEAFIELSGELDASGEGEFPFKELTMQTVPGIPPNGAPNSQPSALERPLGERDIQLIVESLIRLRQDKVQALEFAHASGLHTGSRPLEPGDFDIPQIDSLLRRLRDGLTDEVGASRAQR